MPLCWSCQRAWLAVCRVFAKPSLSRTEMNSERENHNAIIWCYDNEGVNAAGGSGSRAFDAHVLPSMQRGFSRLPFTNAARMWPHFFTPFGVRVVGVAEVDEIAGGVVAEIDRRIPLLGEDRLARPVEERILAQPSEEVILGRLEGGVDRKREASAERCDTGLQNESNSGPAAVLTTNCRPQRSSSWLWRRGPLKLVAARSVPAVQPPGRLPVSVHDVAVPDTLAEAKFPLQCAGWATENLTPVLPASRRRSRSRRETAVEVARSQSMQSDGDSPCAAICPAFVWALLGNRLAGRLKRRRGWWSGVRHG